MKEPNKGSVVFVKKLGFSIDVLHIHQSWESQIKKNVLNTNMCNYLTLIGIEIAIGYKGYALRNTVRQMYTITTVL